MEKIKFTLRFVILLAALPVIMFTELTRKDGTSEPKRHSVENATTAKADEAMLNHPSFMQAVNN